LCALAGDGEGEADRSATLRSASVDSPDELVSICPDIELSEQDV
jgi:hypothetical protein